MEIKTVKKMVEVEEKQYIASDGKEFESACECQEHEKEIEKNRYIFETDKMRIDCLGGYMPICIDGLVNDNNVFRWYNIESEEQLETLNKLFKETFKEPERYPEVYCIETYSDEYENSAYEYLLSDMKKDTAEFWEKLGYKVTLEKIK